MIYVITHKIFDDSIIDDQDYKVLHVGTNDNCKEIYLRDDTGDNISYKNSSYCELTGLYWMWKNAEINNNDAVGLVHYRRFFTYTVDDVLYTYFNKKPRILSGEDIRQDLKKFDAILPIPERIKRTVSEFYSDYHNNEDLIKVRTVIKMLYPDYVSSFDKVMNEHYFYFGNMIITRKKIISEYSKWLFSIMSEVEKQINSSLITDPYQSRIYGFLSERLLQVWVEHNGLKIKTYPVFNTENKRMTIFKKNINRFKHAIAKRK